VPVRKGAEAGPLPERGGKKKKREEPFDLKKDFRRFQETRKEPGKPSLHRGRKKGGNPDRLNKLATRA